MSPHDAIERYLAQASEGLKDDPALRREVSTELASHLEAAIADFLSEGLAEDESVAAALKAVGSPIDVAGELQAANVSRMKGRARATLLVRFLLVPLAGLVTIVHTGLLVETIRHTVSFIDTLVPSTVFGEAPSGFSKLLRLVGSDVHPEVGLTEEQKFILHGDTQRNKESERYRALWESSPDDLVYLGHYMTRLIADTPRDNQAEIDHAMTELGHAMEVEPENARYDFLRGSLLFEQAATLEKEDPGDPLKGKPATRRLVISDRALLDQAMAEFMRGAEKPFYKRHEKEMLVRQRSLLGPPDSRVEQTYHVALAAAVLVPDLTPFMNVMRAVPLYAELLRTENQPDQARAVLDAWMPYMAKVIDAEWSLIGVLVIAAVAITAPNVAGEYEALGFAEEAARTRRIGAAMSEPVQAWQALRDNASEDDPFEQEVRMRGSMISLVTLPALGSVDMDVEILREGRMLDYVLLDRMALLGFELALVLVMLGASVVTLRWRFTGGGKSIPLLLLPTTQQLLRALVLGLVVPVVCYAVYASWSGLGIREFSFLYLGPRLLLELGLLGFTMLTILFAMTSRAVRERCASLQVPLPEAPAAWRHRLPVVLLGVAWLSLLVSAVDVENKTISAVSTVVAGGVLVLFLAAAAWAAVRAVVQKKYGLYHGTAARALVPVLAITVLVSGITGHHIMNIRESHWVRTDRFITNDEFAGFTRPETDLTKRLLSETRAAVAEYDRSQ